MPPAIPSDQLQKRLSAMKAERDVMEAHLQALETQLKSVTMDRDALHRRVGDGPAGASSTSVLEARVEALGAELAKAQGLLAMRDEKLARLDGLEAERRRLTAAKGRLEKELLAVRQRQAISQNRAKPLPSAGESAIKALEEVGSGESGPAGDPSNRQDEFRELESVNADLTVLEREHARQMRELEEAAQADPNQLRAMLEELVEAVDERVRAASAGDSDAKKGGIQPLLYPLIAVAVVVPLTVITTAWIVRGRQPAADEVPAASEESQAEAQAEGESPTDAEGETPDGSHKGAVDPEVMQEVDRLLATRNNAAALALIAPLTDKYPEDAQLLWRYARLQTKMARRNSRRRAQALLTYEHALDADPALADDKQFFAELHVLLKDRRLRRQALDILLHKLGTAGHTTLLDLVNKPKTLGYVDRHRALKTLRANPESAALVNEPLNLSLDLLQASESAEPCLTFQGALERMQQAPSDDFRYALSKAKPPSDPRNADRCEALPGLLDEVRHLHYFQFGTPDGWGRRAQRRWLEAHPDPPPRLQEAEATPAGGERTGTTG